MKSLVVTICILGIIGLVIGMTVKGDETDYITCSVTPATISVSVEPVSHNYGTMLINATASSTIATSTNTGGIIENFNILGADAATTTLIWTLSPTGRGTDIYMHCFTTNLSLQSGSATGTSPASAWVGLDKGSNYKTLATGIGVGANEEFVLDMRTPSVAGAQTDYGEQYDTTVTVQAVDGT
jgi:hypothetical protein